MDFNVELSKAINGAMLRFDAIQGSSGSDWAEAAARDLDGKAGNVRLLRLITGFVMVAGIGSLLDVSSFLSHASFQLGYGVDKENFFIGFLAFLFLGFWTAFLLNHRRTQARHIASIHPTLLKVASCMQAVADAVRPQFGMLAMNLMDVHRRMIKTFPAAGSPFAVQLIELTEEAFQNECFHHLADADASFERTRTALLAALAESRTVLAMGR